MYEHHQAVILPPCKYQTNTFTFKHLLQPNTRDVLMFVENTTNYNLRYNTIGYCILTSVVLSEDQKNMKSHRINFKVKKKHGRHAAEKS